MMTNPPGNYYKDDMHHQRRKHNTAHSTQHTTHNTQHKKQSKFDKFSSYHLGGNFLFSCIITPFQIPERSQKYKEL